MSPEYYFENSSKRRKGFPSESRVKHGLSESFILTRIYSRSQGVRQADRRL
jgi:hypothetical protein